MAMCCCRALQCVAVSYSVLECVTKCAAGGGARVRYLEVQMCCSVLQQVGVCCSGLDRVAVGCRVCCRRKCSCVACAGTYVPWRTHVCAMTDLYVCHDLFEHVTCVVRATFSSLNRTHRHSYLSDMTYSYVCHD